MQSRTTKNSTGAEERKRLTTGIADLDRHIDDMVASSKTAAFVILAMAALDSELAENIRKRLYYHIEEYTHHDVMENIFASEAEHGIEVSWWIGFWQGIQAGHKKTEPKAVA